MAETPEIWIATSNSGKIAEFKLLLREIPLTLHFQGELSYYYPPQEDGDTFEKNARIKARSLKAVKPGHWILGEDTGLEVAGLNNLPGVHTARYAGEKASDAENRAKLLKMLKIRSPQKREAQFRTVLICYTPTGEEKIFESILKGRIGICEKGTLGFGYDSVFIPDSSEQTLAELGLPFKNQFSHRALAIKQFLSFFQESIK